MHVVVMGRNYTSLLSMIRSAGQMGCRCTVIRTVHKVSKKIVNPEKQSEYVDDYYFSIEPNRDDLINILLNHCKQDGQKVILLPTDDYTASTIDLNSDILSEFFLMPHIKDNSGDVIQIMDKNYQKELARQCGLNVASGYRIDIQNGQYTIPDTITYPCFTKPETSFLGDKKCMKKCTSKEELEDVVKEVANKQDCPLLVEEYIEIENEFGVLGYSGANSVFLPCLIKKRVIGSGAHKGVTLIGDAISFKKEYPQIQKNLEKLLKTSGFMGLVDIDLYESKGRIYFNELNLRLGAFGFASLCAGINLPGLFIHELTGQSISGLKTEMDTDILCISEKVNLDDYCDGFCSLKEYHSRLKNTDCHFIRWNGCDPNPYQYFKKIEKKQIIKRIIKNLIGRK